jgi:hypothetical protein
MSLADEFAPTSRSEEFPDDIHGVFREPELRNRRLLKAVRLEVFSSRGKALAAARLRE